MSSSAPPAVQAPAPVPRFRPASHRALALLDASFKGLCQFCAVLLVVVSFLLVAVLVSRSWLAIQRLGLGFLTSTHWNPREDHPVFGALAFVYGTVMTSVIAMAIALPLGIGTAAYLSEVAGPRLRRVASFFIEMLAAIPSVVYGFWGLTVLAPVMQDVFDFFGGPNVGGQGMLTAGIILAIMIVPYIAAITFDVCQAVPRSQREGALALGATRWQTIWTVVLPYARPGIIGGAFLALGRALGETMAVTMLIGNKNEIQFSPYALGDSIASVIANQYIEASNELWKSVLVELGLLLLAVTVVINTLARLLLWRVGARRPARQSGWLSRAWPAAVGLAPAALVLLVDLAAGAPRELTIPASPGRLGFFGFGVALAAAVVWLQAAPRPRRKEAAKPGLVSFSAALAATALLLLAYPLTGRLMTEGGLASYHFAEAVAGAMILGLAFTAAAGAVGHSLSAQSTNRLMTGVLGSFVAITMGLLVVILTFLLVRGAGALNRDFFTQLPGGPNDATGVGLANAIVGSLEIVGFATLFAVPVGLLAAVYLAEYRANWLSRTVRFIGELLGGVPSIVIGIFAAVVFSIVTDYYRHVFGVRLTFYGWSGVFALAVMMVPIVMRASEEALKLVPQPLRNASYALGASQAQTVLRVTVPAALSAIVTAVFLAVARIAGETAPLLLTAGSNRWWPESLNDFTPNLPYYIYTYGRSAFPNQIRQGWAAAFLLMVVVLLLNFGIRFVTGKRVVQASRGD